MKASSGPVRSSSVAFTHLPELDSLRAFAITLVLFAHYLPEMHVTVPFLWYGVDVFFTISGFLITSILLIALNADPAVKKITIIKKFMIRRVLRLFPLYYIFLILFWSLKYFAHLQLWKEDFTIYFFTYTPNILFYLKGLPYGAYFSHLWSLGVEEQFYLVWPWILLFVPASARKSMIAILIISSMLLIGFGNKEMHLLPLANFHTIGAGALLACYYHEDGKVISWLKEHRMLLTFISTLNLIPALFFIVTKTPAALIYQSFSIALFSISFVLTSIFGWKGFLKKITTATFPQYIGKISYGIYIFHFCIPPMLAIALQKLHISLSPFIQFLLYFPLILGIASLSYRFIESPFLRLKSAFKN